MNDRQLLIIKSTWSSVMLQSQEAGELFYQQLFALDPSVQSFFKNDPDLQVRKFISMMTLFVAKFQHAGEVIGVICSLANRHVDYGANPTHYVTVGKALLAMLERQLGTRWNQETQQAWEQLYHTVAETMLAAAANKIRLY